MKTSKIAEIISCRSFEGQFGISWAYKLRMENGDKGEVIKKKENALKVGDELTYEVVEGQYGPQFKVQKPAYNRGGGNSDKAIFIAKAMECTIRLVACGDIEQKDIEKYFDRFYVLMAEKNGK